MNFFPHEPRTNEYYNKESNGGNTSFKGHFESPKYAPFSQRDEQPHDTRHVKRQFPLINPPIEYVSDDVYRYHLAGQQGQKKEMPY